MHKAFRAALFILPVLILLPHLAEFPFQPGASFSDLVVSHYPNGLFLQRALGVWKTIPLWSPAILSGYPFGANPLSGLYYLPGWLAFLFPLPVGFMLVVTLHLIWAGIGMFYLLRLEGLSERAALFGALAFEALPKLYSHLGAGHITLIYAVAWTPWLLYAERQSHAWRARRFFFLPGIVLGIIALADVRWAAYSGLFWLAYSLVGWIAFSQNSAVPDKRLKNVLISIRGWLPSCVLNILIAAFLAAPLLLPLVQYTRLTTRNALTAQDSFVLSMPPSQILGLVFPNIGGAAEWMVYPGAILLGLTLYVLGRAPARRRAVFWLTALLATLIFSLGSFLPPLEWIARLPGMDLLRVPPRVLFITGFCFAAIAALGLDELLDQIQRLVQPVRDRSSLLLFAVAAFVVLFAAAVWGLVDKALARFQFAWGAFFFLVGAIAILLARARRISAGGLMVLLMSMALVDLAGVNAFSLDFRSFDAVFSTGRVTAEYLREQGDTAPFRIYSPSYSLPQHIAAEYRLDLADGVDPLQLASYARFMEGATGVPSQGYSVTLPPFANANPAADNQGYSPDAALLGLLNVKYLVSAFPLTEDGLVLLAKIDQTRIYQNQLALPRAWVQAADAPPGQQILSEPQIMLQPDSIFLNAAGPGLLVLSELAYPGWQATIDGQPAEVETVGGLLRGVRLQPGKHVVQFLFRPWPVYIGLGISALTWVTLLVTGLYRGRTRRATVKGNAAHD